MSDILGPNWFETDALNTLWPEGMPAKNVNDAARSMMGALRRSADQINFTETSTGGAVNYLLTYDIAPEAYYPGQRFSFIAGFANSNTVPKLNVNNKGSIQIRKMVGGTLTDLSPGDIQIGDPVEVFYVALPSPSFIMVNSASALPDADTDTAGVVTLATREEVMEALDTNFKAVSVSALATLWKRGSDITVAAGGIILDEGGYFHILGPDWSAGAGGPVTSITFADPSGVGRRAILIFDSPGKLVNGASLVLPSGADINVLTGDYCFILLDSGSVMRVMEYTRASGQPLVGGAFQYVYKTADKIIQDNKVLTADGELKFTAKAGKTYNVRGVLSVLCSSTQGFRIGLSASTALASVRATWNGHSDNSVNLGNSTQAIGQLDAQVSVAGNTYTGVLDAIIVGGAADSVVDITWCKNDAPTTGTSTVSKDSYISYMAR